MFAAAKEKFGIAGHPENLVLVDPSFAWVLPFWQDAGLLQNNPDGSLKHNAWEHMAAGSAYADAIGQAVGLSDKDRNQLKMAFRCHDTDKDTESAVVKLAVNDSVNWEAIEETIRNAHPIYESLSTDARIGRMVRYDVFEDKVLSDLEKKYAGTMKPEVDKGERIYVARDLIVGGWHDAKLAFEGVNPEVIEMQAATEYSASPAIDMLLDEYPQSDPDTQLSIIKKAIIYTTDNAMRNAEFVDPDVRCETVFQSPNNALLSAAYANHSGTGETALVIQKRVGRRAVNLLSSLMGIRPETFVETVELKARQSIASL